MEEFWLIPTCLMVNNIIITILDKGISFLWSPFLIIIRRNIFFVLFFSVKIVFGSFSMNKQLEDAYANILDLDFEQANKLLIAERINNPNNGLVLLYENYIDFLTILISDDQDFYHDNKYLKNKRIEVISKNYDSESPFYLYCQAEIYLQWAIINLKFRDYQYAIYGFVKAYYLLEKNQKKHPEFILNKKNLIFLDILLSSVPPNYQWIINIAGYTGDIKQSINSLDLLLKETSSSLYNIEVVCLASFLQINILNNHTAMHQYLDYIGESYRDNLLLNYTAARLASKLGLNDYCLKVLEDRPSQKGKHPVYFLDYLQAMSYLYMLDYERSEKYFIYYVNNFKGKNYIKSSYHKLAWIAELQKDFISSNIYFQQVIKKGIAYVDADKVALKAAREEHVSNPYLLKARLCYDGGYYQKAHLELDNIENPYKLSNKEDTIEYWYRLARISSYLDTPIDIVIGYYQRAYNSSGNKSTSYYAPMSLLQIALLYEEKEDYNNAIIYLDKCLDVSGFDYERNIHMKAKAALSRLIP